MYNKPRGTSDLIKLQINRFNLLINTLKNIAENYNFSEINLPIFESKQIYSHSIGVDTDIVSKEMFEIKDKKNRVFVLRPEGTAGTVRAIVENKWLSLYPKPLKLFYVGPMFRYERPQAGRLRQFNQFGVEIVGGNSIYNDLELLKIGDDILKKCDFKNYLCEINFLICDPIQKQKYLKDLKISIEKLNLCKDCQIRKNKNILRILDCKIDVNQFSDLPKMNDYLNNEERIYWKELLNLLDEFKINFQINPLLVRGLDYYNGLVFEFKSCSNKLSLNNQTLIGGGHYDNLIGSFNTNKLTFKASGFAIGIERILTIMDDNKTKIDNSLPILVLPIDNNKKVLNYAWDITTKLRDNNFKTDIYISDQKLKNKFKIANALKAKTMIIIGEKELNTQSVILQNNLTQDKTNLEYKLLLKYFYKENLVKE